MNSFNIFGITGGIGLSFANLIYNSNNNNIVHGYHKQDSDIINQLKPLNVNLTKLDLSSDKEIELIEIHNSEYLLFVSGKPFFSSDFFDFSHNDLIEQIKIDITSLIYIIKQMLSNKPSNLKKVVVVCSKIPNKVNSIYHISKSMQIEMLKLLQPILNDRGVGLSLIHSGWIDTKMMQDYISYYHIIPEKYISPSEVAEVCYSEFENDLLFNEVII